ncbi:MAG: wax ester/triacylglycerol synthase domain-containing protein, partial [Actinomycetota bacterium]
MATEIRFDHKMSDAEALMWRIDKDPYLSSTFANVSVLDRAPDFDRLRRRMERATYAIPRLRQRVQSAPANLTPPLWVEDPDFDIDYHVRRIALPQPGSMRQLLDLATLIVNDPFDRTRPLWQFAVVEGLADGRAVLVEKLHHTIADGEGSIQLSLQFFDFTRDAPEPPPLSANSRDQESMHEHGTSDLWRDVLAGPLKLPLALVKQMRELIADPTHVPAAGAATMDTLRALIGQMTDIEPAKSPLWTQRSLRRRIDVLKVPFDEARSAARLLGGTLNTLLL